MRANSSWFQPRSWTKRAIFSASSSNSVVSRSSPIQSILRAGIGYYQTVEWAFLSTGSLRFPCLRAKCSSLFNERSISDQNDHKNESADVKKYTGTDPDIPGRLFSFLR